ncbi:MAG: 30S ribosomal protein S8 [Planctomycetes bacterium]|nr:30S ribosomal protein S8 [Planctomycetota bacterium]
MMTDPVADMLTRIRNANNIERPHTDMPATKLKVAIAQVLKDEGFILDYHLGKVTTLEAGGTEFVVGATVQDAKAVLRLDLKYGPDGEKVIRHIQRSSRPGRRYYLGSKDLRRVLNGLGISILSTSRGVMSDRQARKQGVGGEVLALVW